MLVLALNPGHDGAIAAVKDRKLLFSLESEKGSFPRYAPLTATTVLNAVERLGEVPDAVALTGGLRGADGFPLLDGAGYFGADRTDRRPMNFLGKEVTFFSSTHERSHILGAIGMGPRDDSDFRAALVWEGGIGSIYVLDDKWVITQAIPVLYGPGTRYANLFALASPGFPDEGQSASGDNSGKLMALAAYGDASEASDAVAETVDQIMTMSSIFPFAKYELQDSPLYNAGVEADEVKTAAALLTERIFSLFANAAQEHLPRDIPLYIAGGCGLNCDWNVAWRELGHFSSVFVPPCPNDSGLAIGTAADCLLAHTGDPDVDWDVYGGLEFEWDHLPGPRAWERREPDPAAIADELARGSVFAWVQGRAEIGPRALGNRSLLAEPFTAETRDRLNVLKQREAYRPVAPCCRIEDLSRVFDRDFPDPYMLHFRKVTSADFGAVTHVDGTARCQTVRREENESLHDLLSAFAERCGIGMLCNTSLNFKGMGFINRMSDLMKYCGPRPINDIVVEDAWFHRRRPASW